MKKLLALAMLGAMPAWALDLNTATAEQIAALKGFTPAKAEAVVAARTKDGPFKSSADVLGRVPGVTQGMLNQNRASLTIAGRAVTTRSGTAPAIPGVRAAIPAKKADTTQATTQSRERSQKKSAEGDDGKGDGGKGNSSSRGGNSNGHGGGSGGGGGGRGGK
ncbi:Helix-hairpin-helix motif-containing protein [Formivibrio citricus]|uniref:Helix-hairpin-helix motif-containing protein n=1 Tax=Formivibrio citricus TaxID=83765 RepID=A0A1I4WT85_9NEIS|nr:helix-hairpin-helix domain-containing protein [Formivibrio citricus]SFN16330.1 Helix-hairpin-helix motif-containing protein [Formivibrio citricus]